MNARFASGGGLIMIFNSRRRWLGLIGAGAFSLMTWTSLLAFGISVID